MADSAVLDDVHESRAAQDAHAAHEAHATSTGISNEKLAMWIFLASECLLFGGLISTYLLYKNRPGRIITRTVVEGVNAGSEIKISELFDIPFTSVSTFVLLASSLTMVFAVTSSARHDWARARLWLCTTAALGAIFIGGQVYEFTIFVKEGMGYTSNVSSSAFYTLTGFHGVHVSIGILMLVTAAAISLRPRPLRPESVEIVGLYWHFVDIIWIVIFTIIYLIP